MTPRDKIEHVREAMHEDVDEFLVISRELLNKKAQLSHDEYEDILVLHTKMLLISGQFEQALTQLKKMSALALSPSNLNEYYYLSARYYQVFENYELAFQYLNYAGQVPDASMSIKQKLNTYMLASSLNIDAGSYDKSAFWINKAIKLSDVSNNAELQCLSREEQAYLYVRQEKYEALSLVIDDAIELCRHIKSSQHMLVLHTVKSFVFFNKKDYLTQQKILLKALSFDPSSGKNFNALQTRLLIAESYIRTNHWQQAKHALAGLLSTFIDFELAGDIATVHRLESLILEHEKQAVQALASFKQYLKYQHIIDVAVNESTLVPLNAQFSSSINQQQAHISQLKDELRLKQLTKDDAALLFYTLLIIVSVIVFYMAIIYAMNRRKVAIVVNTGFDEVTGLANAELGITYAYSLSEAYDVDKPIIVATALCIKQLNMIKESCCLDECDKLLAVVAPALMAHLTAPDVLFRLSDTVLMTVIRVGHEHESLQHIEQLNDCVSDMSWDNRTRCPISLCIGQSTGLVTTDVTRFDIRQIIEQAHDSLRAKLDLN